MWRRAQGAVLTGVALAAVGCSLSACRGGTRPHADLVEGFESHLEHVLGTQLELTCPELTGEEPITCTGTTEEGHPFTLEVSPKDDDEWVRGEVRGLLSGQTAAERIREQYRDSDGVDITSLHCPTLIVEGTPVTCRAHADTQSFEISVSITGSRLDHHTDGLVPMAQVELLAVGRFVELGGAATVDCGHPRARVKRVGSTFSCSAVVDGQSAFVDVEIAADGPKLTISGWTGAGNEKGS